MILDPTWSAVLAIKAASLPAVANPVSRILAVAVRLIIGVLDPTVMAGAAMD